MDHKSDSNGLTSVKRAFEIIETIEERELVGVTELANELELPKTTVHSYLSTLNNIGYVKNKNGSYTLSFRFLKHGGAVRHRSKLYQVAKHEVDRLAIETGEVGNLGVEENGYRVLLYKSAQQGAIHDNAPVGEFAKMHWTALGKAILAHLPKERVRSIIDARALTRANEYTITSTDQLLKELKKIREQGYSVEDQERRHGVLTVAVPIFDRTSDTVLASISVSGPKARLQENTSIEALASQVRSAANVIELECMHY
jgi:DNA-binding IclR family transcriptional regulator